ncbi:MAG: RluA family pseudouridine synthase [Polyangiaceae bacterium]|nr:RluA family pseudouridine synthase [Polyangiaceae bacterium]MCL4751964.1 RluA family pseudouridine synthase [Myxococcales bacterium]
MKERPREPLQNATFAVPEGSDGACLDRVVRDALPGAAWSRVRRAVETGKVSLDGQRVTDPTARVRAGQVVELRVAARATAAAPRCAFRIVHADRDVVVVDKPPLVSSVPFDAGERDTLVDLVRAELSRREQRALPPLGVVHRLDKETSGLVMFARTLPAKRHLKQQLRFHSVFRRYVALVHGQLEGQSFRSRLVEDRGDGLRGSTNNPRLGQPAVTHVSVLERFGNATLVECRLETGRTHQIRIHLAEAGHPLVGERVYSRGLSGAVLEAPRLMLHARELGFVHPRSEEQVRFEAPIPEDMARTIAALTRG